MSDHAPTKVGRASEASHSQTLANLLERLNAELDQGSEVDLEQIIAKHPEYEERLRELLPTMIAMANWGKTPADSTKDKSQGASKSPLSGILGDFRILDELGRGGMGTVYEAEQISMGRRVALKVLPFAALAHGKSLQRFRNEVRAAAALEHPHIVSVYSVGEERGIHYYSMQLIHGQSLAELISQTRSELLDSKTAASLDESSGRFAGNDDPTVASSIASRTATTTREQARISTAINSARDTQRYRRAAQLGVQAAEALQHAHDQGVLHRDIKPGNLMIDRDGDLYVTDFGLARIEADAGMTMTGDIVGTLRYMAPEQALAKRVVIDHRSDIYSLGATLYELLTLHPAFGETDRGELLKQIAMAEPKPLRMLDRHIPANLETIVQSAMAKQPGDRYPTAQHLANDLKRYLENQPIRAKRPTLLERFVKWSQRHTAAVWAFTVTLLVTTMVLAASRFVVERANSNLAIALKREQAAANVARTAERRSGDLLYAADVRLAGEALSHNNVNEAKERLARHIPTAGQPDRRGFAWRYLWSCSHQAEMTLTGHGPAFDVKYSPDGQLLASAHKSGEVVLYEASTGKELRNFAGHGEVTRRLEFSPDGELLAALGDDGMVRIWQTSDRSLLVQFAAHPGAVGDLAFHPEGDKLATVAQDTAHLFRIGNDRGAGTLVEKIASIGPMDATLYAIDISADGLVLACGGRDRTDSHEHSFGRLWLWDLKTFDEIRAIPLRRKVTALSFARESQELAIGFDDGSASVRDLIKQKDVSSGRPQKGRIYEIGFANHDQLLFVASKDATAAIWDVQRQRLHLRLLGHAERVYGAAVSPVNGHYATASSDGAIKVWPPSTPALSNRRISSERFRQVSDAQFSPDGRSIVEVYARGDAFFYDLRDDALTKWHVDRLGNSQPYVGWQLDGSTLTVSGLDGVEPRRRQEPESDAGEESTAASVTPITTLYDADTLDAVQRLNTGNGRPALSPDGKSLAVIEDNEEIHIWDLLEERHRLSIPYEGVAVRDVVYAPNGEYLLAAIGDDLRVWDAKTYELLYNFTDHDDTINRIAVSADSRLAATVSNDMTVRIWSLAEGRHLRALVGHESQPRAVAFSRNGEELATGADDSKIRLWDVRTGGELLAITKLSDIFQEYYTRVNALAFTDENTLAAIVRDSHSTMLYQWHGSEEGPSGSPTSSSLKP